MGETSYGYEYDISWDFDRQQDVVYIDLGDQEMYLTKSDLQLLLEELE